MDTYTYKCPGCGAALEFDPKARLLICNSCGQLYSVDEVPAPAEPANQAPAYQEQTYQAPVYQEQAYQAPVYQEQAYQAPAYQEQAYQAPVYQEQAYQAPAYQEQAYQEQVYQNPANTQMNSDEYMEINVYHCSSCGSEIMTNDVEVSTFCSYCGQSTIMFDRVSREKKPEKIIPFILTKEQALAKAKEKFATAKYLADGMDNVTVESVYGIYMPYWAYDSELSMQVLVEYLDDKQKRRAEKSGSKRHQVLLDASVRFNDYVSKQLNPFPISSAVDFNAAYLTGFYADRSDVLAASRENDAKAYIEEILEEQLVSTVPGAPPREMREIYKEMYERTGAFRVTVQRDDFNVLKKTYMFCPVYFITFTMEYRTIILLVNGCSGKVIGSIPVDDDKVKKFQTRDMIIYAVIFAIAGVLLFGYLPIWWAGGIYAILASSMVFSGIKAKKKYDEMYWKMNSESMFDLSRR